MQGPDASVQRIPGNRAAFSKTLAKCSGGEQKLEISISFELAEDDEGPTIDAQSICILTVIKKKKTVPPSAKSGETAELRVVVTKIPYPPRWLSG